MEEEHANDVVATLVHAAKVHQRVNSCCERTVEPTATLGDKLGSTFGHIGFTLRGFDVRQVPLGACLSDQLETENSILGQEHVLLENVHTLNTLLSKLLRKRVIAMEILFKGASHDCTESIGRECTGQDTNVTE